MTKVIYVDFKNKKKTTTAKPETTPNPEIAPELQNMPTKDSVKDFQQGFEINVIHKLIRMYMTHPELDERRVKVIVLSKLYYIAVSQNLGAVGVSKKLVDTINKDGEKVKSK